MSLADLNAKLRTQAYVDGGAEPTESDAKEMLELFGGNEKVVKWVANMASYYAAERNELAAAAPAKKESKKEAKKEEKKEAKGEKKPEAGDKKPAAAGAADSKERRALVKEAGKKAQDMAGMSDMGSSFQQAQLLEPKGDLELLDVAFAAMNKEVDPDADEKKGGAGEVAKILFSSSETQMACIVHVPEALQKKHNVSAEDWYNASFSALPGDGKGAVTVSSTPNLVRATYTNDPELGRFTLKAKDCVSSSSFAFLRERSLVIDDDSEDEFVFGDDDMPGM